MCFQFEYNALLAQLDRATRLPVEKALIMLFRQAR